MVVEAERAPDAAGPARGAAVRPPAGRRASGDPVFVDGSGRRLRAVRRLGWVLVVPAAGYAALLVSSGLGGPTLDSPYLPLPQEPGTHGRQSGTAQPDASAPSSRPAARTSTTAPGPGVAGPTTTAPAGVPTTPTAPAATRPAASVTPTALPTPTVTHGRSGSHPQPTHTGRGHA